MALQSSGAISLNDVNVELGNSGTATISLGDTRVRSLFNVDAAAPVSLSNGYGKSSVVNLSYTFSANTADATLNLSALSGYSAGKSNITVTINSGVYLYATSTSGYGLSITGGTTGDTLTIVNNGYIMGRGGDGGMGASQSPGTTVGAPGGAALNLGFGMASCTINNTNTSAYIGGGGGGGGGTAPSGGGGGGAGGGIGGPQGLGSATAAGGGPGSVGATDPNGNYTGGGGGRIFPGTGGAAVGTYNAGAPGNGGGAGGSGAATYAKNQPSSSGAGGSSNNAGGNGAGTGSPGAGGGGGWGAVGGSAGGGKGGGSGGKAVNLNGKSVTWTSGNTTRVWGSVA